MPSLAAYGLPADCSQYGFCLDAIALVLRERILMIIKNPFEKEKARLIVRLTGLVSVL